MPNPYFRFKQFTVYHDRCAMKVTTDSCVFGAWAADEIQKSKVKIQNLLDIGTGTGLLSLMIAQKNDLEIEAVEIDEEAAMQARENVLSSPWDERLEVHHDNILLFQSDQKFDVIISNPPFYENELQSGKAEKNIAHHSEELLISQVVQLIAQHLNEKGIFFLLYPYKRQDEINKLFQINELYPLRSVILKQSVKHQPFRIMTMGTKSEVAGKRESSFRDITMSIRDENQQYTEPFVSLLKDYYLYL
jgi:tRNA1Val (adenine37-N6)-methyltransferase